MADKIKKFFKKKKADAKFRAAGPGYRLNQEPSRSTSEESTISCQPTYRHAPSTESKQAAAAALARLGGNRQDRAAFNTSLAAIQAQVRRELEAEKKALLAKESETVCEQPKEPEVDSPYLAVSGVFFRCPMIGPEVLTKDEWNVKIKEFLYEQLEEERGLTACLIIHSCNKNREKVEQGVDTLCKYLENIIQHPDEEKYKKIRTSNRVFQDKVAPLEGVQDFLTAAGFKLEKLPHQGGDEDFYVFSEDNLEGEDTLQILYEALQNAEPIGLELDRNLQVLLPSQVARRNELPPVFFTLTPEEVKREQQLRSELAEKSLMLRTKAMREKEELREMRRYRYALIRIRFPDGIFLQGTFSVYEKLEAVFKFLQENLMEEAFPFTLATPTGQHLIDEDRSKSLVDLRLVPASILTFIRQSDEKPPAMFLQPEVMMLVQDL